MNSWDGIASLFIACLEAVLIINILVFSEKTPTVRKGMLILILLFTYQSIEFVICGLNVKSSFAVYLAFADISFLPPAAVLFVLEVFNRSKKTAGIVFLPGFF